MDRNNRNLWILLCLSSIFLALAAFITVSKLTSSEGASDAHIYEPAPISQTATSTSPSPESGALSDASTTTPPDIVVSSQQDAHNTPPTVSPSPSVSTPPLVATTQIMAWIYPGSPACDAAAEIADGRKIDVAKAEYFRIDESGLLTLITEELDGCNGYSPRNVAHLKKYSTAQYVTVSANYAHAMGVFLATDIETSVTTLTNFVTENNLTGVELDFEDFGGWTPEHYADYKKFIRALGEQLHAQNKKLMVDGPAVSNAIEEAWYPWRYADFKSLPVDYVVIMAYDYQFDHGAGNPVSPLAWIEDVITFVRNAYPAHEKIVVGLPSYGYRGIEDTQKMKLLTYAQIQKEPGFETAVRDAASGEMTWKNGDVRYYYQDSVSLGLKRNVVEKMGITSISVWHLGGNMWFK